SPTVLGSSNSSSKSSLVNPAAAACGGGFGASLEVDPPEPDDDAVAELAVEDADELVEAEVATVAQGAPPPCEASSWPCTSNVQPESEMRRDDARTRRI